MTASSWIVRDKQRRIATGSMLLVLSVFLSTCKDEPTRPPAQPTLQLSAEDASCTEAWLKISSTVIPSSIALRRNGQTVSVFNLVTSDSVVVDDSLLPGHTYVYEASRLQGTTETTTPVQLTTLDTTSHNFTWEWDTLGVTASTLNDVAIINDTLAYAVGEMYLRDSTGQIDPVLYNAARWDGTRWTIFRIPYIYHGSPTYSPITTLFTFNENDIWFDNSVHWDGQQFRSVDLAVSIFYGIGLNKIWGNETTGELYVVGNSGTIAYSPNHGTAWQRVESGTTLAVRDIWGATNARTGECEILALASTYTPELQGSMVFRITGNSATPISTTGMSPDMLSTWFVPGRRYYAVGAGIHQKRMLSDSAWSVYPPGAVTRYYSGGIRGQDVNDIFVVGSFGEVVHFNGQSWFRYFSDVPLPTGAYGGISVRDRLMMTVGLVGTSTGTRGAVLIGRR